MAMYRGECNRMTMFKENLLKEDICVDPDVESIGNFPVTAVKDYGTLTRKDRKTGETTRIAVPEQPGPGRIRANKPVPGYLIFELEDKGFAGICPKDDNFVFFGQALADNGDDASRMAADMLHGLKMAFHNPTIQGRQALEKKIEKELADEGRLDILTD